MVNHQSLPGAHGVACASGILRSVHFQVGGLARYTSHADDEGRRWNPPTGHRPIPRKSYWDLELSNHPRTRLNRLFGNQEGAHNQFSRKDKHGKRGSTRFRALFEPLG